MVKKIAFGWVKVLMKAALILQDALQFGQNQFGQLVTFLEIGLSLFLLGRHLPQSDLFPNAFPQTGVFRCDAMQFMESNITLLRLFIVAVETVALQKRTNSGLKGR